MPSSGISLLAVVTAAVVNMVIGFVWYGPAFGRTWAPLAGVRPEDIDRRQMPKAYGLTLLAALVVSYALALVVDWADANTASAGARVGFWVWLGFFAAGGAGRYLFPFKPLRLYLLDMLYQLVVLLIAGALLAVW